MRHGHPPRQSGGRKGRHGTTSYRPSRADGRRLRRHCLEDFPQSLRLQPVNCVHDRRNEPAAIKAPLGQFGRSVVGVRLLPHQGVVPVCCREVPELGPIVREARALHGVEQQGAVVAGEIA